MVDPNDPETKRQIDAYLEHEKHEPIGERVEDAGERYTWWWRGAGIVLAIVAAAIGWQVCR